MTGPSRDDAVDESVSARMKRTVQKNTAPELAVRRALYAKGLRYRIDLAPDGGWNCLEKVDASQAAMSAGNGVELRASKSAGLT